MKPIILTFGGKRLVAPSGKAIFRYGTATIGGVTYKTVKIGNQEWMAENLKLDDSGTGIYTDSSSGEKFYTRSAAVRVAANVSGGWHIPDNNEFTALCTNTGVTLIPSNPEQSWDPACTYTKLLSITVWTWYTGRDYYGFNLLPTGWYTGSRILGIGYTTNLWSTDTLNNGDYRFLIYHSEYGSKGAYLYPIDSSDLSQFNVRLVRNM